MIDARLENLLFFSITFRNVLVNSLAFIFFNKLSKILSLSIEVIKGLLTTRLNSLLSFKIFFKFDKSPRTGSTSFFLQLNHIKRTHIYPILGLQMQVVMPLNYSP